MKHKLGTLFKPEFSNYALDARSLSLFRIALGLVLLFDLVTFLPHIDLFYSNEGVLPTDSFKYKHWYDASIHALYGGSIPQIVIFIIHGLAAVALMFGLFTRPALLVNLILLLSLHHRFPAVLNGGDSLLGLLLFWSLFLPLDAEFRLFKKYSRPKAIPKMVFGIPTFALCLQVGLVYAMTVLLKNNNVWLYEASALFYSLNLTELIRPVWAGSFKEFSLFMKIGSIATMAIELFLGFAILWPWRNATLRFILIGSGLLLHTGIFIVMDIGPFAIVDIVALIPFIPSRFWDRFHTYHEETTPLVRGTVLHKLRIARNAFLILCICSVLVSNLKPYINHVDPLTNKVLSVFDLYQNWNMFSDPSQVVKWIDIVGVDQDEQRVKVEFPGAYTSDQPPSEGVKMYQSPRLQKYVDNITNKNFANHRKELLKWLCENAAYKDQRYELDSVSIIVYKKANDPFATVSLIQSDTLATYCCDCDQASELSVLNTKN